MELPADILVHNAVLNLKGSRGRLLAIDPQGYYEVNLTFGDRVHRVLLPIAGTVIIASTPEEAEAESLEVER